MWVGAYTILTMTNQLMAEVENLTESTKIRQSTN